MKRGQKKKPISITVLADRIKASNGDAPHEKR